MRFHVKEWSDVMASGIMQVTIQRYNDVMDDINNMRAQSEKAIQRTISDFKSRGPSWISQEVCKEYNCDVEIMPSACKYRSDIIIHV